MSEAISAIDWWIIGMYLAGLITWAIVLSRSQANRADYYVGGRSVGPVPVGISILATQCSTNSILGAPAFVAFAAGGGLVWLQYELAVPLAMIGLILLLMPLFRQLKLVSVYEFLEHRFDLRTRLIMSGLFLFVRAFATAVTVYSIALVIDLITGVGFFWSVVLLGVFTVIYDCFGGIRGVIYSDVLQLGVLVVVLIILLWLLVADAGGMTALWQALPEDRQQTIDFSHHGFGDGHTFAFWPMLFGGLFLYMAYYGCDQSQTQRILSTRSIAATNQALLLNGLARFPLVALYCFVGVGIAVFAINHPSFLAQLPVTDSGTPQYNLAVPWYMLQALPAGLVGLALVALFAAAMSSLDSVLNSLSATTMEDFVTRFRSQPFTSHQEIWLSRGITALWGLITLAMAFYVDDIAPTVLEAINKIGSLANGSILAVFLMGVLWRRVAGVGVCVGLVFGITTNAFLWKFLPSISWLWWNVIGFVVTALCAALCTCFWQQYTDANVITAARKDTLQNSQQWWPLCALLGLWFGLLFGVLVWL